MGLKDDFLEALNSVKKDIFNGSEDTDPNNDRSELSAAEYTAEKVRQPKPEDEIPPQPIDDDTVFDAFNQASEIDDIQTDEIDFDDESGELHSSQPFSAEPPPTPFREYDPEKASGEDDVISGPPVVSGYGNGNRMYEFDRTDLYSDDKTIISKNTTIRGALQTDDSVRLLGQVLGDIDCKSNIVVAGKVRGNTSAANAYIMDAQIDGSLICDDVVSVSSDAWVLGDVRAQQAEIDGKIKGNLDIRHTVSIGSTSSIIGNISTDELEIKRGAFINGQIAMYTPSRDVLDRFDHFEK